MRVTASLFLLLMTTSCITPGGTSPQMQAEMNSLKHSSIQNRKDIAALKSEVQGAQNKDVMEALRTSQTTLFTQVTDMTDQVQGSVANIDEIRYETKKAIEKMQAEIDVLRSSAGQGSSQADGESMGKISSRLDSIEGALGVLKTQVAALGAMGGAVATEGQSAEELMYQKAYDQYEARKFNEARTLMQKFIARYPDHKLVGNALFWIGETYYNQKNYDTAILAYESVIDKHPKNQKVPAAHLKQAYCFIKIGENVTARGLLSALIQKYPDSDVAKTARKKLKELK